MIISPSRIVTINPSDIYRKKRIEFEISVITRIRDIPEDRFGIVYTKDNQLADTHEAIINIVESLSMFNLLVQAIGGNYSVTNTFVHFNTTLNPIHLYPGFFRTKSNNEYDDKLAGYRTYSTFSSPHFYPIKNALVCF